MLNNEPDLRVIGSALNGLELLQAIRSNKPDIIILDIEMPVMDGIKTLEVLQSEYPEILVIILSMTYEPGVIRALIEAGAKSYLKKNCDGTELVNTIRAVYKNGYSFSEELSHKLFGSLKLKLTPAELNILQLICQELSSREIAEELNISENTVEVHRKSIFKKLRVKTALGALKEALKQGFAKL